MGKLLWVNLSTGDIKEETPEESLFKDFIGGYGVGARILYSRQKGGVDPLGPENTLGLVTGPLTGTPATTGCRYTAVGKSPLTGGWGDANSGGFFGPNLKFSGYDGVFLTGISEKPVYLLINNGQAELKNASHLWGKTTLETDDILQAEHGKTGEAVSIGPAGEKLARVACLMNRGGDAAGRSGLGAVMGSKKLKAVVARGEMKVPAADIAKANRLRQEHLARIKGPGLEQFHRYGTSIHTDASAHSGDTPVRNWGGVGVIDLPDVSGLNKDVLDAKVASRTGCWRCPVACRARFKAGTGEYKYPAGTHRPEYETMAAFGAMCLNSNADAISMANHICNAYGLDTISTGTIIAFAMECYEHGVITKADTDGIELNWGNHEAMIALTGKIARREGFGDVLADGVKVAAGRIGRGAEQFAVHIGGQELGLHDPKFDFPFFRGTPTAAKYQMDAAPGRHTAGFGPTQFLGYVINAAGLCLHSNTLIPNPGEYLTGFLSAVTGWDRSMEELLKAGERIGNMRHVFTLREGDNPLKRRVHGRIIGRPPLKEGPLAGVSSNIEAQVYWNLGALDWDTETTRPSRKKLLELGLDDVAGELWPLEKTTGMRIE
jgi:aldehyde:ferredoxin oxidoreductase